VLLVLSVSSPLRATAVTSPDDRARSGVPSNGPNYGAACRAPSLGVLVLLLLGLLRFRLFVAGPEAVAGFGPVPVVPQTAFAITLEARPQSLGSVLSQTQYPWLKLSSGLLLVLVVRTAKSVRRAIPYYSLILCPAE
jgi:hypothetical protein